MSGVVQDVAIEAGHATARSMKDAVMDGGLMLSQLTRILLIVLLALTMTGCAAIAGIFKAGVWTGVILVVVVIVIIVALVGRR
jgi:hypothetical protein